MEDNFLWFGIIILLAYIFIFIISVILAKLSTRGW